MQPRVMTEELIEEFLDDLQKGTYSRSTLERYRRDVLDFYQFAAAKCRTVDPAVCSLYLEMLKKRYKVSSINSILNGLNKFFKFTGWEELRFTLLKFRYEPGSGGEGLSLREYERLLAEAERHQDRRLSLLMQTICTMAITVSEHRLVTREALERGYIVVNRRGGQRAVYFPGGLGNRLMEYCRMKYILSGPVFVTAGGKAYDRSNIHKDLKQLCASVGVPPSKVSTRRLLHLSAVEPVRWVLMEAEDAREPAAGTEARQAAGH